MLHPKRTCSRWKRFLLFLSLRGLFQQGLAGVCTGAERQWPRQPALPSCQRVSLRLWFPVALMAACTCSLNILHPLPRYLLIQKSLPSPLAPPLKDLGPQYKSPSCWEIFITQGWDRGLKLNVYYQRGKDFTTVHRVHSFWPCHQSAKSARKPCRAQQTATSPLSSCSALVEG